MDMPIVVKLSYPVKHGTEELVELVAARRLQAKDLLGIVTDAIKFDDMLAIISRLFAVPLSVVKELDAEDLAKAVGVVNRFLVAFRAIGSEVSP